jgi:serine/threonine protein kinase
MGEVYKAKDTRLERTVAVKVLPSHLSASPETRQRFEREAKTISQFSHPHICALYDVGREGETEYLVMEYLEGETLSDRLAKGPLPLEQTLKHGTQIADALAKAHRQVVHRDLKPATVMLTQSGVKLLDFGLAKAMAPAARQGSLTSLPTQQGLTQEGSILGTFQYMAPEQLEGKEADARTDIWALGCLLYELATAKKAFSSASQASLISSIMTADPPPISTVQSMSPPALDRVVKTCRQVRRRWQSAHDVAAELRWIAEAGSQAGAPAPVVSRRRPRAVAWAVAALLGVAAPSSPASRRTLRPALHARSSAGQADGRRVAPPMAGALMSRPPPAASHPSGSGTRLARDAGPRRHRRRGFPFWSPDGRSVAFFQDGRLRRVGLDGGAVQTICESGPGLGGSWSPEGRIVFAPRFGAGLMAVAASGGTPVPATSLDSARGDAAHLFASFLPDGRHFLFVARNVTPRRP